MQPDNSPLRSAWIEVDLQKLKRNYELIQRDKPAGLKILAIVKDEAYGHGAIAVSRVALHCGADFLGVSDLDEALNLRDAGITAPILLLYERHEREIPLCIENNLTCCVADPAIIRTFAAEAAKAGKRVPIHLKINTGMNRYGVRWDQAGPIIDLIASLPSLRIEGVVSHFSMSDELDKSFALMQLAHFEHVLKELDARKIKVPLRHICNSGGFLDLPQAHFDMVRLGILQYGVFPSQVCRRIAGIEPVMSVKARVCAVQNLQPGDKVSYGMRYEAPSKRRVAVLPIGYGDGFPRVRNAGFVLLRGKRAPIIGSLAMDALMVDITDIPEAGLWDEAVVMGRQGNEEISVHEIAKLKGSVSYDVLVSWKFRMPRVYLPAEGISLSRNCQDQWFDMLQHSENSVQLEPPISERQFDTRRDQPGALIQSVKLK
jgi:alanine racemase